METTVRPTAVLIEDGKMLLLAQRVSRDLARQWSLPGGALRPGETIEQCLLREVAEETGLQVEIQRLLYLCDRITSDGHVVHITFLVRRVGGEPKLGAEPEPTAHPIRDLRLVPLSELCDYGFRPRFRKLAEAGFPDGGTYRGPASAIGL
jgi:ADP-ribose pyrophosphatase YjhB (NUDIX family)